MTLTQTFITQMTDPFRLGMLVILFVTMMRTKGTTGTFVPLAAGAVFVAVLIPMTLQQIAVGPELYRSAGLGLVANALILVVIFWAHRIWSQSR
jgi:hypothetical protein